MAKIFSFNEKLNGSYIDSVSGVAGTNNNGKFERTEKGMAWKGDGTTNKIDCGTPDSLVGDKTFVSWLYIRSWGGNGNGRILDNDKVKLYVGDTVENINFSSDGSTNSATDSYAISLHKHYCLIVTRSSLGVVNFFINNVQSGTANQNSGTPVAGSTNLIIGNRNVGGRGFDGYLAKIDIYDHILTAQERAQTYNQFLHAYPRQKETYPKLSLNEYKPTDLSKEVDKGLVAAYNMIPSGNTLVDISGNGNNADIALGNVSFDSDGLKNKKDGHAADGFSFSFPSGTDFTIASRVKCYDSTNWINNYGMFCTGSGDYIRISTGLNTFNYYTPESGVKTLTTLFTEQEYVDFVFVRSASIIKLYCDGVETGSTTITTGGFGVSRLLGLGSSQNFGGWCSDLKFYNYAFNEQQAIDYHNSFVKPVLLENFSNYPVGQTI